MVDEFEVDDPALIDAVVSAIATSDLKNTEELSLMSEQIKSLEIQLKLSNKENKELTEKLALIEKSNYTLLEQLKKLKCPPQAILVLENALLLKANAGGAIKEKIKEALHLIK